nr:glycosyltransferase family 39 protein [Mucilaginibacter sp. L294]
MQFNTGVKWATGFYSGFPNFSAFAMLVFGKGWWAPRIGNAIVSAITVVYCARSLYLLYPVKIARVGITLLIFSPVFISYTHLQLKDTLLVFLISGVLYHFLLVLNKKASVMGVGIIVIYLSCMLFIRAATIPPILIAIMVCLLFTGYKLSLGHKIIGITIVCLVVGGVIFFWNYLSDFDLLQSPETYFQSRYDNSLGANAQVGQKALISTSKLAYFFSAPLFILGSIVLPIPLAVKLQSAFYFTNYEYTANIFSMALTPFFAVALYNWFKNRKKHKELIFIIAFYFIYKVGQAFSLSILSLRQSLPSVLCMYMIVPFFFLYKPQKFLFRLFIALDILAIVVFAVVRLSTRNVI